MAVRAAIVLGILAALTCRQVPVWASDTTLWAAAVAVNSTSPRPAFNYALALRKAGRGLEAVPWLVKAADRATGHAREADYRKAVAMQFFALEVAGVHVCDSPSLQAYCYP